MKGDVSESVSAFTMEVSRLLGWLANETGRGRLTGVQIAFLSAQVARLEAAYKLEVTGA